MVKRMRGVVVGYLLVPARINIIHASAQKVRDDDSQSNRHTLLLTLAQ